VYTILICGLIIIISYFGWEPAQYTVWDRQEARTLKEYAPQDVAKSSLLVYAHANVAEDFKYNYLALMLVNPCNTLGQTHFSKNISKKEAIQKNFIARYDIDMSVFNREYYYEYNSVNDWFTRTIKPSARPIDTIASDNIVTAPADARYMFFEDVTGDFAIWVKQDRYSLATLLGDKEKGIAFAQASLMIARLAPADYHRFHSPVTGNLTSFSNKGNRLYSVNNDAVLSSNEIFYNKRQIGYISTSYFGDVAYVPVGATCVGSINITRSPGELKKGDEIGYFKFGSTVLTLFKKGTLIIDPDLIFNSLNRAETFVKMGTRVGIASSNVPIA